MKLTTILKIGTLAAAAYAAYKKGLVGTKWHCKDCGHTWQKLPEGLIVFAQKVIKPPFSDCCPNCHSRNIEQAKEG